MVYDCCPSVRLHHAMRSPMANRWRSFISRREDVGLASAGCVGGKGRGRDCGGQHCASRPQVAGSPHRARCDRPGAGQQVFKIVQRLSNPEPKSRPSSANDGRCEQQFHVCPEVKHCLADAGQFWPIFGQLRAHHESPSSQHVTNLGAHRPNVGKHSPACVSLGQCWDKLAHARPNHVQFRPIPAEVGQCFGTVWRAHNIENYSDQRIIVHCPQ